MEILNTIEEQNKQIIVQTEEMAKQMKSLMAKPAPIIDSKSIIENIAIQLKESNKSMKTEMLGLSYKLGKIEKNIQEKKAFWVS